MRGAGGADADSGTRRSLERQSWSQEQGIPPHSWKKSQEELGCGAGTVGRPAAAPGTCR